MKTILSGIKTWTRGEIRKSTADWSQSDPNADNYVKNRTHWEEDVEISVIPKQQTTIFYPYVHFEGDVGFDPEEGATYIVTFNGTRYELTAWHFKEYDWNFIGNRLYVDGVDDGSNIPFACDGYLINAPHGVYTISISTLVDGIETEVIEEQTLFSGWTWDFGDIPIELGNVYSVNFDGNIYEFTATEYYDPSIVAIGNVTQYPFEIIYADGCLTLASTATGIHDISLFNVTSGTQILTKSCIGYCPFYDNIDNFNLEVGQTYTVVWDDKVYSCIAKNIGEGGVCIGNLIYAYFEGQNVPAKNTNEPFLIVTNQPGIYLDSKKSHTVSVFATETVIHKLDSKYINLPENIATTDDVEEVRDVVDAVQNYAYSTTSNKMDKNNPQGTGSFSMNRRPSTIIGNYSHAEGQNAMASGSHSHAEGQSTEASGECQHVQGKYNIEDTNNQYAHIVGNGPNDNARSNAHTLDWEGNAWFQGEVYIGGAGQDDSAAVKLAKVSDIPSIEGLATTSYVDTAVASLVNSAPEALNTLDELAAALGDDSNFATTVTNQIAAKQDAITGTAGQFVVIGTNGKPTTKTIPYAEEAEF